MCGRIHVTRAGSASRTDPPSARKPLFNLQLIYTFQQVIRMLVDTLYHNFAAIFAFMLAGSRTLSGYGSTIVRICS
jgi:hypothetical protein